MITKASDSDKFSRKCILLLEIDICFKQLIVIYIIFKMNDYLVTYKRLHIIDNVPDSKCLKTAFDSYINS